MLAEIPLCPKFLEKLIGVMVLKKLMKGMAVLVITAIPIIIEMNSSLEGWRGAKLDLLSILIMGFGIALFISILINKE